MGRALQIRLYEMMKRARRFDERLIPIVSGFYHPGMGQEAIGVGICSQLNDDDYLLYSHRGCGEIISKGLPLDKLFADFLGRIDGTCRGKGAGIVHVADPARGILGQSGTLGGCFPLAFGAAVAAQTRGSSQVAVCFFGEGTSSRGTFHESLNWAAVRKAPLLLVCSNNGWAISARAEDTIAGTMTDRAAAYGIPAELVDGQDVEAVYEAGQRALQHLRSGNGPYFIEAKTYRMFGHYVGDDQSYRSEEDIAQAKAMDPLPLFRQRLLERGFSDDELNAVDARIEAEMDRAIAVSEQSPKAGAAVVFDDLYA